MSKTSFSNHNLQLCSWIICEVLFRNRDVFTLNCDMTFTPEDLQRMCIGWLLSTKQAEEPWRKRDQALKNCMTSNDIRVFMHGPMLSEQQRTYSLIWKYIFEKQFYLSFVFISNLLSFLVIHKDNNKEKNLFTNWSNLWWFWIKRENPLSLVNQYSLLTTIWIHAKYFTFYTKQ